MAQHFLLSKEARTLTLAKVFRMSEDDAYATFRAIRWEGGEPFCPHCGGCEVYEYRARRIFKCKACRRQFSMTSGTLFASRKLELRDYLAAIAIFCNGVKGVSALQLSRDLGVQYKTAFVLAHKLREAMASEQRKRRLSGEVEIDGCYFGGWVKLANIKALRADRRRSVTKSGKRQVVVAARQRGGKLLTNVYDKESGATEVLTERLHPETVIYTDAAFSWKPLHRNFRGFTITTKSTTSPARTAISRRTASKASSRDSGAPKWASTIQSPASTSTATPTKWRGARTTAGSATASSSP